MTSTTAREVTAEGLVVENSDGIQVLKADTILLAAGMKPDRATADEFYNTAPRVFEVGDQIKPGRVADAVKIGHYRALDI